MGIKTTGKLDIEIPAESRKEIIVSYQISASEHSTFYSKGIQSSQGVNIMWEFPVHVAYHLVHSEPYWTIKLKDPIIKLVCGDQMI